MKNRKTGFVLFWAQALCLALFPQNAVTPLECLAEPPTLICAGFEWTIRGDDNRNAAVAVSYRPKGEKAWKEALPLMRLKNERVFDKEYNLEYVCPNMFAGSIFDLIPGAAYEARLTLSDPDGVRGASVRTLSFRTRAEPVPYDKGRVFHVYPPEYKGLKTEPSFEGLKEAFFGPGFGDWNVVAAPRVQPGDVILVHAGLYKADRWKYASGLGLDFHGTYVLTKSGAAGKPVTIKSAGDGEAVFDGNGCYRLFDVMAADHICFEDLTIRNCDIAFYAGLKNVMGCSGLTVKRCRLEDVGIGVLTEYAGSRDFYIADNVMIGRHDTTRVQGYFGIWKEMNDASDIRSYYGVKVYGQGHVACRNRVAGFHDGICICTHGLPEKERDRLCLSIDFYNNDIFCVSDDFFEGDGGVRNIRIFRNRGFNSGHHGLSAQPVYGGPAYYFRNIVYNAASGGCLKLNVNPSGLLVFHNTFIAELGWTGGTLFSNARFRNNLFLGTDSKERPLISMRSYTGYSSFDYDGFRLNKNSVVQFRWKGPLKNDSVTYVLDKSVPWQTFTSLKDFTLTTGHEKNGRVVDYDVFVNVTRPDHDADLKRIYRPESMDFRLKPGSAAVDAGEALPNINDGFSGTAPDLGAMELGAEAVTYGPGKE